MRGRHLGHALQPGEYHVTQRRGIPRAHEQHDVVLARHQGGVVNLRDAQYLAAYRLPRLLGDLQEDVGGQPEPAAPRVDPRGVPGNDPAVLQPLHPGVGAGPGNVQVLGQRAHRQPTVRSQRGHDPQVSAVQGGHLSIVRRPATGVLSHMAKNSG
jgi:hypothetical protein